MRNLLLLTAVTMLFTQTGCMRDQGESTSDKLQKEEIPINDITEGDGQDLD